MKKSLICIAVCLLFTVSCGGKSKGDTVVLNYPTFQVGVNTSAKIVKEFTDSFNEKYAGKYEVVIEEIPGDANYVEKIKVMLNGGKLPPVIYGAGYNLLDLALSQDSLTDLTDSIKSDSDWIGMYTPQDIEVNSRNGKIYGVPNEKSIIGYYYNKELFAKAGITKPAETWQEFFAQCDSLLKAGITPLAMDTADSAWVTSLWLGAMVATESDKGFKFIQVMNPTDYTLPEFVKGLENIQKIFQKYTTKDAIGGKYENAANNFLSGKTAMIANGSWMMGDFSDTAKAEKGFENKVGAAKYPGNFIYNDPIQGYLITKNEDPKVIEASIAFVRHMTSEAYQKVALENQGIIPSVSSVEVSDKARANFPLLSDIVSISQSAEKQSKYLQGTMYPNLLDVMSRELPNLASGAITPKELADILTKESKKNL